MTVRELKAALRHRMKTIQIAPEERASASTQICTHLQQQEEYLQATTVLLFAPLPDEPDLVSLLNERKRFCFPRYQSDGSYAPAIANTSTTMRTGKFGILEPPPKAQLLSAAEIELTIIPGLAFGKDCFRLGRGRGYYDRWLGELSGFKIGICFEHQLVNSVPVEGHDIQLDCVLTPSIRVSKKNSH